MSAGKETKALIKDIRETIKLGKHAEAIPKCQVVSTLPDIPIAHYPNDIHCSAC